MCLLALILWIWGQAGKEMGIFSTIIITYVTFRKKELNFTSATYKIN